MSHEYTLVCTDDGPIDQPGFEVKLSVDDRRGSLSFNCYQPEKDRQDFIFLYPSMVQQLREALAGLEQDNNPEFTVQELAFIQDMLYKRRERAGVIQEIHKKADAGYGQAVQELGTLVRIYDAQFWSMYTVASTLLPHRINAIWDEIERRLKAQGLGFE